MNGMYEELIEKLRKNNRMSGWTHIDRLIDEAAWKYNAKCDADHIAALTTDKDELVMEFMREEGR